MCAGAFFAGDSPYNGVNLTSGVAFRFYSLEARGIRKAAVPIVRPGNPMLEHYWEDGPELSGWGQIAAKYPDGTPAIVQARVGRGWVMLSGVHPEAPKSWRTGITFTTRADSANAFAATLVGAALNGRPLPTF